MKLRRGILIGLGTLTILAILVLVAGTVWINSFLHSDAFRHEVETHASQELGSPVEIKQVDWSIWSGATVNGLATKVSSANGSIELQVATVSCSYSLGELLQHRLHLKSITIEKPHIVLTEVPPKPRSLADPSDLAVQTGEAPSATADNKEAPMEVILDLAKIDDGNISVRDPTGASQADLTGIALKADTSGYFKGEAVTGTLTVSTVAMPHDINLTNFSTPFSFLKGAVTASPFEATAFSGKITGDFKLEPGKPSLLEVNATQIDLAQAGQAANPQSPTRLSGALNLQSTWNAVETGKPTGRGDAQISNGKLEGVTVLRDLASAFNLSEMSDPELKSVTTHFEVADGATHFSNLQIISTVFEMSGQGVIDPAGKLTADMTLTLHADAFKRIPGIATHFFTKLPDGGASIPFRLSGMASNPQSDVTTRMFIQGDKINKTIKKTFDQIFK